MARLMSYAMLLDALDTGGVWSIARGLARDVRVYKSHLAQCDLQRRNDLDGRGNLSDDCMDAGGRATQGAVAEEALVSFTQFFLETCLDLATSGAWPEEGAPT